MWSVDPDFKSALDRFGTEVRKDLGFFGGCGLVVGLLTVWQPRLKELGLAKNPQWATQLFSDFMSINAFGLIFFGYLLLACTATTISGLGHASPKLEGAVLHLEGRLAQIASSLVSFMLGLSLLVIIYSLLNLDAGGAKLVGLTFGLVLVLVGSFVMALAVGRRAEPFDKWWVALPGLIVFVGSLFMLIRGNS